jgi:hypothetical protein
MLEIIFDGRPWLLGIGLAACMVLVAEAGFRVGRKSGVEADHKANIQVVEAAILGVLGLLLGFTVSMAVSRFDSRRLLTLDEANAIGTAHLRAQLMPAPEGPEIAGLLREYVDVRVRFFAAGNVQAERAARENTAQQQKAIWLRVNTLVQKDNRSLPAGLLVQSLNQVFDLENASWATGNSHVPATVICLNAAIAMLSAIFVGYLFGLSRKRQLFSVAMQAIAISAVLAAIVDLDLPNGGLIRVSRQPMIDLQQSLAPAHH